ncbi:HNRNPABD [Mytilus edulis]|uniref:HNRNPABD n=1 Tax=Mytilus edulis TaxID=6550 RepID=A0A8S3V7Y6_MYTED|nr:HNRNPABD [Mytilus edulis]
MAEEETPVAEQIEQQNGEEFTENAVEPMEGDESGGGDQAEGGNPEDEDDRKLFVGNLSWETTQKDLKDYFCKYGEVENCTLKTEIETKRSRGFGFVVFKLASVVDKVLEEKEHKLNGRTIDPKKANPRREVVKKIFVGKCDPSTEESEIKEYFSKFGKVEKVELPFDKQKDQRRGFVFVEFDSEKAVEKVLNETAHKMGSQEFDVKKATPTNQSKRGGRGGFFDGGRGGRGRGGGYNQGYYGNQGGAYPAYNYGGYGNYDSNYYNNYGYGWGGYDQSYYGGYGVMEATIMAMEVGDMIKANRQVNMKFIGLIFNNGNSSIHPHPSSINQWNIIDHGHLKEAEDRKKELRRQELETIRIREAADEIFRRNEEEKRNDRKGKEINKKQKELALDRANLELIAMEEEQFQEYATKVIDHCEKGGRNVYPLRKAAQTGAGEGVGPKFEGKGGIRPSYMVSDKTGRQMPHYQRDLQRRPRITFMEKLNPKRGLDLYGREGSTPSQQQVNKLVFEQWLLSDLHELGTQCLPEQINNSDKFQLNGKFALQIDSMVDISQSCYSQLQRVTGTDNANVDVSADTHRPVSNTTQL